MRIHRLALLVALGALLVATTGARADFEESFRFDAEELRIVNLLGEVTVEGHAGSDFEVVVSVQGRDATRERITFDVEEGREAALHVEFPVDDSDEYVYPRWGHRSSTSFQMRGGDESWLSRILGRDKIRIRGRDNDGLEIYADITVRVPAGTRLDVFHGAGEIRAQNAKAALRLDSHAGSIEVADVEGDVLADTGSGGVTMIDVEGDEITADTGSGSIEMRRVRGASVLADTGSGSVNAWEIAADELEIDTGSGSVELELIEVGRGEFVIDTGSGSIEVTVPANFSAVVEASTASGGVSVDIADIDVHHRDRDEIEFTVGGGDAHFELDAGSGSIRIASR